jgi:hypothetical protein
MEGGSGNGRLKHEEHEEHEGRQGKEAVLAEPVEQKSIHAFLRVSGA